MSQSSESSPVPSSEPSVVLEVWLPQQLSDRMIKVSDFVNISPMVFLRKSIDMYRSHRTGLDKGLSMYPDKDHLRVAFDKFQQNGVAQMLYKGEVAAFLELYEQASAISRDQEAAPTKMLGFMNAKPTIPAELNDYISEQLFPVREPGYFLSPQEFAIAATCELVWLYTLAGPKPASQIISPDQLRLY